MSKLTAEQQLVILWNAMTAPHVWAGIDGNGRLLIARTNVPTSDLMYTLEGTRDECIEQLLTIQVTARLDGKDSDSTTWPFPTKQTRTAP